MLEPFSSIVVSSDAILVVRLQRSEVCRVRDKVVEMDILPSNMNAEPTL
jgi:hypothetical protein